MKTARRLISLVCLIVMLVTLLASCKEDPIANINEMYKNSAPTKIVTQTVQTMENITLTGKYTLTTGTIGGKEAAVYEEEYQQMRDVESGGATTTIYGPIEDVHNLYHYIKDKGTRQVNPNTNIVISDWNPDGKVYSIEQGSFAMNLHKSYIDNVAYENHVFTCTVSRDNTANVFGLDMGAEVKVTITENGAQIVKVTLEYDLPADGNVQAAHLVIDINYTYDNERITID